MIKRNERNYIPFDVTAASGYPNGKNLRYECTKCGDILLSMPKNYTICSCGNIRIDVDAGRLVVEDHNYFKIFSIEENS